MTTATDTPTPKRKIPRRRKLGDAAIFRDLRARYPDLSLSELGDMVGLDAGTMSSYTRGKSIPSKTAEVAARHALITADQPKAPPTNGERRAPWSGTGAGNGEAAEHVPAEPPAPAAPSDTVVLVVKLPRAADERITWLMQALELAGATYEQI